MKKEKPKHLFAMKIPNTAEGRTVLKGVRKFANRDRYKFRVFFDGPRQGKAITTRKKDATGFRVYFYDTVENPWRESYNKATDKIANIRKIFYAWQLTI